MKSIRILLLAAIMALVFGNVALAQDPPVPDVVEAPEVLPVEVPAETPSVGAPVGVPVEVTPTEVPPVAPVVPVPAEPTPAVVAPVDAPVPVPVVGEPVGVGGVIQDIPEILNAFKGGQYLVGVALILLVLISVVRMFWTKIPPKAARWVAVGVGFVGGIASSLAAGAPWYSGLLTGLTVGLSAIGTYECFKGIGLVHKR